MASAVRPYAAKVFVVEKLGGFQPGREVFKAELVAGMQAAQRF